MTRLDDLQNYTELFAGRYKIIKYLGKDYLGTSYLAADTVLDGFNVELKIFNPNLYTLAVDKEKLYRELQVSREINHANIVRIFEVNKTEELIFISREHVDGPSLTETLAQGMVSIDAARRLMRDICAGIAAIHEHGVVHGNIYPSSIFTDKTGFTKVADFGVSFSPCSDAIEDQELLQIIKYKAPEISKNNPESKLSDLYSLGVVLYQLLTGRLPIEGETVADINNNIIDGNIVNIEDPSLPPSLTRICSKLLSKDPIRRGVSIVEALKFFAGSMTPLSLKEDSTSSMLPSKEESKKTEDSYQHHATLANPTADVGDSLRQGIVSKAEQARLMSAFKIHTGEESVEDASSSEPDPIFKLGLLGASLVLVPAIAALLLTPWEALAKASLMGQAGGEFYMMFLLTIIGMSVLISTPATVSYFVLSAVTQGRISLKIWLNLSALSAVMYTCLLIWALWSNPTHSIAATLVNPPILYGALRETTDILVQANHLIPRFSPHPNDILYYSCIAIYCLGAIGIMQASSLKKEKGVLVGAAALSLVIYLECALPSFKFINLSGLTNTVVPVPIGDQKLAITGYDFVCGLINWGLMCLMMAMFEIRSSRR